MFIQKGRRESMKTGNGRESMKILDNTIPYTIFYEDLTLFGLEGGHTMPPCWFVCYESLFLCAVTLKLSRLRVLAQTHEDP